MAPSRLFDLEVLLIDFNRRILDSLRGFDLVTEGLGIFLFCADSFDVLPEPNSLLVATTQWGSRREGAVLFSRRSSGPTCRRRACSKEEDSQTSGARG